MIYLDTNILIYLLEDTGPRSQKTAGILEGFKAEGHDFASSVLTITEFLAGTTGSTLAMLLTIPGFSFHEVNESIAAQAAQLQRTSNLRVGDALHLATALHMGCTVVFTNDKVFAKIAGKHIKIQTID